MDTDEKREWDADERRIRGEKVSDCELGIPPEFLTTLTGLTGYLKVLVVFPEKKFLNGKIDKTAVGRERV